MTLEQVKAAKPTLDYDPQYGSAATPSSSPSTRAWGASKCESRFCFLASPSRRRSASRSPRGPPRPRDAQSRRTRRSHRLLGFRHQRRLALAHGHAHQGRLRQHPRERRSPQNRRSWDPAKDEAAGEQCKAYGAPAIMRVPGRVHITWQDDNTLKFETDAGTQTRMFHFAPPAAPRASTAARKAPGRAFRSRIGNAPRAASRSPIPYRFLRRQGGQGRALEV